MFTEFALTFVVIKHVFSTCDEIHLNYLELSGSKIYLHK